MAKSKSKKPVAKAKTKSAKARPANKSTKKTGAAKKAGAKSVVKSAAKPTSKPKSKPTFKSTQNASAKTAPKSAGKSAPKQAAPKSKKAPILDFKNPTKRSTVAFDKLFSPLDDRVLVEASVAPEKTAGGLYIPEMVQERPTQGRVVAVGQGARRKKGGIRPLDVRLGDQVLFGKFSGQKLVLEGREVILLKEEDILGVVKD